MRTEEQRVTMNPDVEGNCVTSNPEMNNLRSSHQMRVKTNVFYIAGRRMSRSVTNMSELVRQEISDYVDKKAKEPLPDLMSPNSTIPALSPAYRTTQMSTATNSPRLQRATSPDTEPVSPRDRISSITSTDSEDNCNMSPRVTSEGMPLPSPPLQPRPPSQAKRNARHLRRAQVKPQDCIN